MNILPIVKSDPYLAPYADAIYGRYEYFKEVEKKLKGETKLCPILLPDICILVCIDSPMVGFSGNGLRMLRLFFSLAILITGNDTLIIN